MTTKVHRCEDILYGVHTINTKRRTVVEHAQRKH